MESNQPVAREPAQRTPSDCDQRLLAGFHYRDLQRGRHVRGRLAVLLGRLDTQHQPVVRIMHRDAMGNPRPRAGP